jgi:hypothetical protein
MTINLTDQELDYIIRCLTLRPYGEVHQLIPRLVEQANAPPAPDAKPQ